MEYERSNRKAALLLRNGMNPQARTVSENRQMHRGSANRSCGRPRGDVGRKGGSGRRSNDDCEREERGDASASRVPRSSTLGCMHDANAAGDNAAGVNAYAPNASRERELADGSSSPPKRRRCGQPPAARLNWTQVDRAVRVVWRLQEMNYERETCLTTLRLLYEEKEFPETDHAMYNAMINLIREQEMVAGDPRSHNAHMGLETLQMNRSRQSKLFSPQRASQSFSSLRTSHCSPRQLPNLKESHAISRISGRDDSVDGSLPPKVVTPVVNRESRLHCKPRNLNEMRARSSPVASLVCDDGDDDSMFDAAPLPCAVRRPQPVRTSAPETIDLTDVEVLQDERSGVRAAPGAFSVQTPERLVVSGSRLPEHDERFGSADKSAVGIDCEVVFLLDTMERLRSSDSMAGPVDSIAALMLQHGVNCETRALPCGDGIFIARFPDASEVVLDYIIERKTLDDYVHSIGDGRVARQSYVMRQSRIAKRMFILEGDMNSTRLDYNRSALMKKLTELEISDGFYVKNTKDLMNTTWFYTSMHKRLQKKFKGVSKEAVLRGRCLFTEWKDRMKSMTRSLTLEQLHTFHLCQTKGVAVNRAQQIINQGYRTPQDLFRAFDSLHSAYDREKMLCQGNSTVNATTSLMLSQLYTSSVYGTQLRTALERGES